MAIAPSLETFYLTPPEALFFVKREERNKENECEHKELGNECKV